MRGITLWQPHASLMALGSKGIETRSWATAYRGQLMIHAAAKKISRDDLEFLRGDETFCAGLGHVDPAQLPLGVVVAVVDLVACLRIPAGVPSQSKLFGDGVLVEGVKLPPDSPELEFGDYTEGRYAWVTKDLRRLERPVPFKAMMGLWEAPADLVLQVLTDPVFRKAG